MNAIITEAGNGFPGCGDMVYDSAAGDLLVIVTPSTDIRICTGGGRGAGNYIEVEVERADQGPTDLTEAEWDEVSDCGVEICG